MIGTITDRYRGIWKLRRPQAPRWWPNSGTRPLLRRYRDVQGLRRSSPYARFFQKEVLLFDDNCHPYSSS